MALEEWKAIVSESDNIVFFGGAGTSTESGIPDFRSAGGLYETGGSGDGYTPEQVLSRDFFMQHTEKFYSFYKTRMIYPAAMPNAAHLALVDLERREKLRAVITQNIDGLHQLAGSKNVLELHGSVHRNRCMSCNHFHSLKDVLESSAVVPTCKQCGGLVKPDVVLYQESLDMDVLQSAASFIRDADVLIVAGTSLTVQPAAGLIRHYAGDKFILINKSATPYDKLANFVVSDSISTVMTQIVDA